MISNRLVTKIVAVGIALFTAINCSTAQSKISYKFGLTGGVNAAQLQQTALSHLLWRYNAGATLEQSLSPGIRIAYQLTYSQQGSSTPLTGLLGDDKLVNTFDYLSLPVLLRLSPRTNNLFLEVGGQAGYLLAGKGYFNSAKNQATPFKYTRKFDVGLTGGIGYRLGMHWVVDARYYYGLQPILADHTEPDPQTGIPTFYRVVKWYNRVWSLNMSYYF